MSGQVALSYGNLINNLWNTPNSSYSPRDFKFTLSRFAPSFSGYAQQDTQEFLAFLLDGLHEDLNRIYKKPYTEIPDWNGGDYKDLANLASICWDLYKKRNDSIIVDLFQGQFKSTVNCPQCDKVSITFDPFMYLTLPLPIKSIFTTSIYYIPYQYQNSRIKINIQIALNSSIKSLKTKISNLVNVPSDHLWIGEEYKSTFFKSFNDEDPVSDISIGDNIYIYQLPIPFPQDFKSNQETLLSLGYLLLPVYNQSFSDMGDNYGNQIGKPLMIAFKLNECQTFESILNKIIEFYKPLAKNHELINDIDQVESNLLFRYLDGSNQYYRRDDIHLARTYIERSEKTNLKSRSKIFNSIIKNKYKQMVKSSNDEGQEQQEPDIDNISLETLFSKLDENDQRSISLLKFGDGLIIEWNSQFYKNVFGDNDEEIWENFENVDDPEYVNQQTTSNKSININDCLDEFTKEEKLGEEDLWYCSKCQKHQQAIKKFDVWKCPDILVVHFKRFSSSRFNRDKLDQYIDFPLNGLNLSSRVGELQTAKLIKGEGLNPLDFGIENSDEDAIYDLYAIDNHYGGLGGGHYTTYAKNQDNFYHFDDSFVSKVSEEDVKTKAAYLLFYKKRTSNRKIGGESRSKAEKRFVENEKIKIEQKKENEIKQHYLEIDENVLNNVNSNMNTSDKSNNDSIQNNDDNNNNNNYISNNNNNGYIDEQQPPDYSN